MALCKSGGSREFVPAGTPAGTNLPANVPNEFPGGSGNLSLHGSPATRIMKQRRMQAPIPTFPQRGKGQRPDAAPRLFDAGISPPPRWGKAGMGAGCSAPVFHVNGLPVVRTLMASQILHITARIHIPINSPQRPCSKRWLLFELQPVHTAALG